MEPASDRQSGIHSTHANQNECFTTIVLALAGISSSLREHLCRTGLFYDVLSLSPGNSICRQ